MLSSIGKLLDITKASDSELNTEIPCTSHRPESLKRAFCFNCKSTEPDNKLMRLDGKDVCHDCLPTLSREKRVFIIDNASNTALKKYDEMMSLKGEARRIELNDLLCNSIIGYNGRESEVDFKHSWLLACCLDKEPTKESDIYISLELARALIEPVFENQTCTDSERRLKLQKWESAKHLYEKILEGNTDYGKLVVKPGDNEADLPKPPQFYYLGQFQPINWRAMGNTFFSKHRKNFDDHADEIIARYPDNPRRQQIEMFKIVLSEGYLKNWQQIEEAIQSSKKTFNQVPTARHKILLADTLREARKTKSQWWLKEAEFVKKWQEVSRLLKNKDGWSDLEFPQNEYPRINELIPHTSWVFGLLIMSGTGCPAFFNLDQKADKSLAYENIIKSIRCYSSQLSWIVFYICAHVSAQLPRFQQHQCTMIDEYIKHYGNLKAKAINFDDPEHTLTSLYDSANNLISRIIDSLKNTNQDNAQTEPAAPQESLSLAESSGIDVHKGLCTYCLDQPLGNITFVPCGHISMCNGCANNEQIKTCPMCRGKIQLKMKLYPSGPVTLGE